MSPAVPPSLDLSRSVQFNIFRWRYFSEIIVYDDKLILIFGYFCLNNHDEAIIRFVLFQLSIN